MAVCDALLAGFFGVEQVELVGTFVAAEAVKHGDVLSASGSRCDCATLADTGSSKRSDCGISASLQGNELRGNIRISLAPPSSSRIAA